MNIIHIILVLTLTKDSVINPTTIVAGFAINIPQDFIHNFEGAFKCVVKNNTRLQCFHLWYVNVGAVVYVDICRFIKLQKERTSR